MKINDKAPDFLLKDKDGKEHSLSDVGDGYKVVYFYPKDNTPGCTFEARGFNKDLDRFRSMDTSIIGISGGNEETKEEFCDKNNLHLTLLSDSDFSVSNSYGVYGERRVFGKKLMGINRVTFILDKNNRIIKIFDKIDPLKHSGEVLEYLGSIVRN